MNNENDVATDRGQKMLALIGIRLQHKESEGKSNWKVSTLETNSKTQSIILDSQAGSSKEPEESASMISAGSLNYNTAADVLDSNKENSTSGSSGMIDTLLHTEERNVLTNIEEKESSSSSSNAEEPFSADDSIQDPDYSSDSSSSSSTSSDASTNNSDQNQVPSPVVEPVAKRKRSRKNLAAPSKWKKNSVKRLRNSGKSYKTLGKGLEIPKREIRQPCDDTKCRQKCSTKFSEQERLEIFEKYRAFADIVKQRIFIMSLMQEINPKKTNKHEARVNNNAFYFIKDGERKRVCKYFFTSTLGITNRCIRTVISKNSQGTLGDENRGKHNNHKQVAEDIKNGVRSHIASIPTIEKVNIEGSKTIAQLHRDYKIDCDRQGKPSANLTLYRKIFNYEFNIAFFVPKKDQCQRCTSYQNSTEEERSKDTEYATHLEEKKLSREEKERDKNNISQVFQVACFDLQATLPTPNGQVSSFYYRSKLSTYNFTVCDLSQKKQGAVNCYMWHEGEGRRGAIEIGSSLLQYLKEKADALDSNDLEIVFYSDNCAGQQKNKFVIAAYLYAVANFKIKAITHKFLVTGHTQNEGDNVHSLIEKNIKRALKSGPIYTPAQYVTLVQTSRKTGIPFKVIEMTHDDFFDLKNITERTSVNFNKNSAGENLKFSDISIFRVEKQSLDRFYYKMSFNDNEYKSVNVTQRRTRTPLLPFPHFQLEKAYNEMVPITKKKYDDLMFLLKTNSIIKSHALFYNSLKFQ